MTIDELREKYRSLPDARLRQLAKEADGLTPEACAALLDEIAERGLVITELLSEEEREEIQALENSQGGAGCLAGIIVYALVTVLQMVAQRWKSGTYEIDLLSWRFYAELFLAVFYTTIGFLFLFAIYLLLARLWRWTKQQWSQPSKGD